jgi:WD40 repeat protein
MAIKPWQATIKPPKKFLKPEIGNDLAPKISLELHHVFGYHSANVRNNLKMLPYEHGHKSHIIYFTGALGINHALDVDSNKQKGFSNKQKFFSMHNHEITAMDLSEDKRLVATGDRSRNPKIYIWDSQNMIELGHFQDKINHGVRVLKFSPNASKLLAVSCDEFNSVFIYNINDFTLITHARGDTNNIIDAVWMTEQLFFTVGIKHFKKWEFIDGRLSD